MDRIGKIQNSMVKQDHVFFILSNQNTRCWMIVSLVDDSVSYPLPELGLGGPEFFAVATNDPRCSLLFLLLNFRAQVFPFHAMSV